MIIRRKTAGLLGTPYIVWAAAFIVIPLIMVVWYGLTDEHGAFTLANVAAIADPAHSKALLMALILSLIATIVCILLAYPLCLFLVQSQQNSTSFLTMLLIVPMWMNFLLRTYAWQSLLEKTGIINTALRAIGLQPLRMINTNGAIVLGMVYNFLPFMILPVYNALEKIDQKAWSPASRWSSSRLSRRSSCPHCSAAARSCSSEMSSSRSSCWPMTGISVPAFHWSCSSLSSSTLWFRL